MDDEALRKQIHDEMAKCAISYAKYGGGGQYFYDYTDAIMLLIKQDREQAKLDELTDQVILSTFLSQQVYSKVQFDNAKDANMLQVAAQENSNMLVTAVKAKLIRYKEEITVRTLEQMLKERSGTINLRNSDDEWVTVKVELTPTNSEADQ